MAKRSTRKRILFQIGKTANAIDLGIEHLAKAHVLSSGRHPKIEERMPELVTMLEGCKNVLEQFKDEL